MRFHNHGAQLNGQVRMFAAGIDEDRARPAPVRIGFIRPGVTVFDRGTCAKIPPTQNGLAALI